MTSEPQNSSGSQDNTIPPDPGEIGERSASSRRQFFAQVTHVGTRLVAGLSLLQTAPDRAEAAPVADVANTLPTQADVARLRANLEQPLGTVSFVTTYVYDIQGKLMRR